MNILIANGADVNWKYKDGESLLHMAAMLESTEVVRILVENGADVLAENDSGRIPLYWANDANNEKMGRLLAVPGKRDSRKKENDIFFEKYLREEVSSMREMLIKSGVKIGGQTPEQALKEFDEEVWFLCLNGENIDPALMVKMKVLNKKFKPFSETAYDKDENVIDKETGELASLFSCTTEWQDNDNVKIFVQVYNNPLGGCGFTYKARYFHGRWFIEYLSGMVY